MRLHLITTNAVFSRRFQNKRARQIPVNRFFVQEGLECDEIFLHFVQLNENPGNASKVLQSLPFHFLTF